MIKRKGSNGGRLGFPQNLNLALGMDLLKVIWSFKFLKSHGVINILIGSNLVSEDIGIMGRGLGFSKDGVKKDEQSQSLLREHVNRVSNHKPKTTYVLGLTIIIDSGKISTCATKTKREY